MRTKGYTVHLDVDGKAACGVKPRGFAGYPENSLRRGLSSNLRYVTCLKCEAIQKGPTFTAVDNNGRVWYAKRPHGNLAGELPLGSRPVSWGAGDEPWDGAVFQLESGRTITVTMDKAVR